MFDGSLRKNWKALVTFQQMIILCDAKGIVDITPESMSARTGIPIEIIEEGIRELEQEDPSSRSPEMNGKRIVRLDPHRNWGWYLVNYEKYRNLRDEESRRNYMTEYMRKYRENKKCKQPVNSCKPSKPLLAQAEAEALNTLLSHFSPEAQSLTQEFLDSLLAWKPSHKRPSKAEYQKWVQAFERMIRLDKRSPYLIRRVMTFARRDEFWCPNIRSPLKLRKQFDQLEAKMAYENH